MSLRFLGALLDAADLAIATIQRLPLLKGPAPYNRDLTGCPYDEVCARCPAACEDDVCLPEERRLFELAERHKRA